MHQPMLSPLRAQPVKCLPPHCRHAQTAEGSLSLRWCDVAALRVPLNALTQERVSQAEKEKSQLLMQQALITQFMQSGKSGRRPCLHPRCSGCMWSTVCSCSHVHPAASECGSHCEASLYMVQKAADKVLRSAREGMEIWIDLNLI